MGLRDALARFAVGAPVPVFPVVGGGARWGVQDLRLSDRLTLLDAPRSANVLLVAGALSEPLGRAAVAAHDTMSHPRVIVRWPLGGESALEPFRDAVLVGDDDDVVEAIACAHADLLLGRRASEAPILPDEEPAPWRGIGPYGQGGTAMTGGVPYGRPLASLADDRDGLRLDQLTVVVGPLFAPFPPGLVLDVQLHGDVIEAVSVRAPSITASDRAGGDPFLRALREPVALAELELARARSHLRWLAEALRIHGLSALGQRVLRLARDVRAGDAQRVRDLERALRWTMAFSWATAGLGRAPAGLVEGLGLGPIARASGIVEDLRAAEAAYVALGFEPITQREGDARARWRQHFAEAAQSLDLAARAGGASFGPVQAIESPHGRLSRDSSPSVRLLPLLPRLIEGMEWGAAVTTLVSLDLDLEETALDPALAAPEAVA